MRLTQAQLKQQHSTLLVTAVGEAVVACVLVWIIADELQILDLAVDPRHRRQGFALQLIQDMFRKGVSCGAQQAVLEVHSDNTAAIGLYQHVGFRQVHVRRAYYRDNGDALVMIKQLHT